MAIKLGKCVSILIAIADMLQPILLVAIKNSSVI
jgi:hypothetical protein